MEEDWSGCYGFLPWYKRFYSNLSLLRSGGFAGAMKDTLSSFGLELHSRAVAGSGRLSWVVGIHHLDYLLPGFLSLLDFKLRCVNEIQASLNEWLEGGRRTLVYSLWKLCVRHGWDIAPEEPSEPSEPAMVVVSAVVLLALVYQYLAGNVDRGGSRAYYSRSSLDFRDIYVAVVLFLGAYVWIKFREVALRGVHKRTRMDKQGRTKVVYEARLKPPKWKGKTLTKLELGQFATPQEAHNQFLIVAFYYSRATGFLDGWFPIPPMNKKERRFAGEKKKEWVISQAKKVYKDYKRAVALFQDLSALVREPSEAREGQAMQEHVQVNVDPQGASFFHPAEQQQLAIVSQAENWGTGMAMTGDNHGLERAAHSLNGMRLSPPKWEGKELPKLELGRFATPQEAHNKFLIAAFYYNRPSNRPAVLLDGWFPIPPMSEEERRLVGEEKRTWVIGQAKKVYEDFLKKKAERKEEEASLLQELLEVWDEVMPKQDEVNVDFLMTSLLNFVEHQQPGLASQVENSGMGMAMLGDSHGLECASHSFDGLHEGLAPANGHSLGSQEGSALPVSQLPPNWSGMSFNGSDLLALFQTLVHTLQQQISDQKQQIFDQQQQNFLNQQQIQEFGAQLLRFQNQQGIQQQQQLQESRIQDPHWSYQIHLQEQRRQDVNQGVPSFGIEMEQSVNHHNHSRLMTPPPDGGEDQQGI